MSYPEKWFTSVIESKFNDKDYNYDFRVGKYRLDFAWPKKMRYIEIDGDQHYMTEEAIEHDRIRKEFLESKGWTELRFSWSYISSNKDECIKASKSFIDNVSNLPLELQYKDKRKEWFIELEKRKSENPDKIDSTGRYNPYIITTEECSKYFELISKSDIDITKFGWKLKAAKLISRSKKVIGKIIEKFPDYFINAYKPIN